MPSISLGAIRCFVQDDSDVQLAAAEGEKPGPDLGNFVQERFSLLVSRNPQARFVLSHLAGNFDPEFGAVLEELKRNYEFDDLIILSISMPYNQKRKLLLCYLSTGFEYQSKIIYDLDFEFLNFPFILNWLWRKDFIDRDALEYCLNAIVNMSPSRFMVVREIVNRKAYNLEKILGSLNISKRTFEKHIGKIHDDLMERLGMGDDIRGYRSRIVDITNNLGFFNLIRREPRAHVDGFDPVRGED